MEWSALWRSIVFYSSLAVSARDIKALGLKPSLPLVACTLLRLEWIRCPCGQRTIRTGTNACPSISARIHSARLGFSPRSCPTNQSRAQKTCPVAGKNFPARPFFALCLLSASLRSADCSLLLSSRAKFRAKSPSISSLYCILLLSTAY